MRRASNFLLYLFLMLTLGVGTVAHAGEQGSCVDSASGSAFSHGEGDADQVPADSDKAYPHHHGNCHGHHIGLPITPDASSTISGRRTMRPVWTEVRMAGAPSDPDLRPPKA